MIKNFITVSVRNILKSKLASAISIFSLLLSLSFSLVIFTYTHTERTFDNFIPDHFNKYRINYKIFGSTGLNVHSATTPSPYAPFFSDNLPEIKSFTRLYTQQNIMLGSTDKSAVRLDRVGWSDANLLDFFGIEMLIGRAEVTDLNSLLLSENTAVALFGSAAEALGQPIDFNGNKNMVVAGVFEEFPDNSTIFVQALGNIEVLEELIPDYYQNGQNWGGYAYHTYLELAQETDINALLASFHSLSYDRFEVDVNDLPDEYMGFELINVADIHLYSDLSREMRPATSILRVKLLEFLALLIAIIGWINFVNLQSARIPERLKEVGVRRCLGAQVKDLRLMFFLEYLIMGLLSLVIAAGITYAILPKVSQSLLNTTPLVFGLGEMAVATLLSGTLIAAIYPSIIAARQIKIALQRHVSGKKSLLRNAMLSVQFIVSLFLVAFTLVINAQIGFMSKQDPGFDPSSILVIEGPVTTFEDDIQRAQRFASELRQIATVEEATFSTLAPGRNRGWEGNLPSRDAENNVFQKVQLANIFPEFFEVMNAEVLAGRIPEGPQQNEDLPRVILNETAVRGYNWTPEQAIGQKVGYAADSYVVAVIKDFNTVGAQQAQSPMVFIYDHVFFQRTTNDYFLAKVNDHRVVESLRDLEEKYADIFPGNPFKFSFSDELFMEQYEAEYNFGTLVVTFSILSIILSLTGLVGVTSYHVILKRKEIGVRKVLGSGVGQILWVFVRKYLRIMILSSLLALPVTFWYLNGWLEGFATRISISPLLLAAPIGLMAALVCLIVGLVSIRAARSNMVNVLREE